MWLEPEWPLGASSSLHSPRERTLLPKSQRQVQTQPANFPCPLPVPGPGLPSPGLTSPAGAWRGAGHAVCARETPHQEDAGGVPSQMHCGLFLRAWGGPPREMLPSTRRVPSARWPSFLTAAGTVVLGPQSCLGNAAACRDLDARGDLFFLNLATRAQTPHLRSLLLALVNGFSIV